jgi:geranylgeranyl pyrophosphate synthase
MNIAEKLLGPNADLAVLMSELFAHIPDADEDVASAELLNKALFDPARDILSRSGKGLRACLLERCWQLAGPKQASPPEMLPVLIELLHVGSLVIDDIEDGSPMRRGAPTLHRRYGVPIALNTGNWFYFLPLALLSRLDLDETTRLAIYEDISLGLLHCHQGQALDLSVKTATVSQRDLPGLVARATRLKTGSLMELAAAIGARAAGAPQSLVGTFARFGADFGVGLQMLDDWSGIRVEARRDKGLEDIHHGGLTWPWAWLAQGCDEVTYAGLMKQLRDVSTDEDAQQIVSRLRLELGTSARLRIHAHLQQTLGELHKALGDSPEFDNLSEDVARLERAYG